MTESEAEVIKLGAILLSTERWSKAYSETPVQHAQLLKATAQFNLILRRYFKAMAKKSQDFINVYQYMAQVKPKLASNNAFNVDVIINDSQIDNFDDMLIQISLKTVSTMVTAGVHSGESAYDIPLGIQSTDAAIQALTTKEVAGLVGRKVLKDGSIVNNPNAAYNINDTVRNDIAEAVKTSLGLGETTDQLYERMYDIIDNPARAERIANTEAVNAYQNGLKEFGHQSGAVGKEWEDAGAIDECADNAAEGIVDIDGTFSSGDSEPPAHPNCLCSLRLVYPSEMESGDESSNDSEE